MCAQPVTTTLSCSHGRPPPSPVRCTGVTVSALSTAHEASIPLQPGVPSATESGPSPRSPSSPPGAPRPGPGPRGIAVAPGRNRASPLTGSFPVANASDSDSAAPAVQPAPCYRLVLPSATGRTNLAAAHHERYTRLSTDCTVPRRTLVRARGPAGTDHGHDRDPAEAQTEYLWDAGGWLRQRPSIPTGEDGSMYLALRHVPCDGGCTIQHSWTFQSEDCRRLDGYFGAQVLH